MTFFKRLVFCCFAVLFCSEATTAQVILAFQGGEPGDTWGYTSTLASAIAAGEAQLAPNIVSGTASIVVGGNTGGGSCFSGGSGNGPNTPRTFTFNPVDISQSNDHVRTLTFNWGNRYPMCNGTGWDGGENLVFTAYHNGSAQPSVTLATGNNNAPFSIQTHQYTWDIPACVNMFSFVISVTTNRADELLFLDDVELTTSQMNGSSAQPSPISGPVTLCPGATGTYAVINSPSTVYTWSGLPVGASFSSANGTNTIDVNWGTAAPGTYTLSVTPAGLCGGIPGPAQTIDVTLESTSTPAEISGPTSFCAGTSIVLSSNYTTGNTWSSGETTQNIDVTTPGTYTLTVQTACGTLTDSYVVTVGSVPGIQSVQENDISCAGQTDGSISINATGTNPEYSLNGTNWQPMNGFFGLGAGTYTIHVRETGGCESTATATIDEPAALSVTASGDGPFCSGSVITLHAVSNATGTSSYSWIGPNGYTSAAQNPVDATEAGTYSVVVSQGTCSSPSSSTIVDLIAVPQAQASNSGPYCNGESIQLTGNTDLSASVQYQWTGPNGYTSSMQNPTDAVQPGTYNLIVTNNGCASQPASTTVLFFTIPDAAASYNAPYCPGTPVLLNGTTTASPAGFSWTGPGGYTSSAEDPTNATQTGTYTLVVTSNGCTSAPASVTVSGSAPVMNATNSSPVCEGTTVQLNGTTSATGTITYNWSGPNGFTSSQQNPSGITVPGMYSLTLTANGCPSVVSTNVIILPAPVAAFPTHQVCESEVMNFQSQSTVTGQQTITNWNWSFGDGTSSTMESPGYVYSGSGTFPVTLEVTTNAGCSASVTHNVSVAARPHANFYFTPDALSSYEPEISFINTSSGAAFYEWHFDTGMQTPETSPTMIYTGNVNHSVMLIAFNSAGCKDSITKVVQAEQSVVYYVPNAFTPDGDEFNNVFRPVFTEGFDPENYSFVVFNRWGEIVFESRDPQTGWDGTYNNMVQTDGSYAWNIRFKHRETDAMESINGHVTMIR